MAGRLTDVFHLCARARLAHRHGATGTGYPGRRHEKDRNRFHAGWPAYVLLRIFSHGTGAYLVRDGGACGRVQRDDQIARAWSATASPPPIWCLRRLSGESICQRCKSRKLGTVRSA